MKKYANFVSSLYKMHNSSYAKMLTKTKMPRRGSMKLHTLPKFMHLKLHKSQHTFVLAWGKNMIIKQKI